jgi:hypothetical protein
MGPTARAPGISHIETATIYTWYAMRVLPCGTDLARR